MGRMGRERCIKRHKQLLDSMSHFWRRAAFPLTKLSPRQRDHFSFRQVVLHHLSRVSELTAGYVLLLVCRSASMPCCLAWLGALIARSPWHIPLQERLLDKLRSLPPMPGGRG